MRRRLDRYLLQPLSSVQSGSAARRGLGAALLLLASLPVYRLLAVPETGPAGAATVAMSEGYSALIWSGTLVLSLMSLVVARFLPLRVAESWVARLSGHVLSASPQAFTVGCGLAAALFALLINQAVLHGEPPLVDAVSQLLQARYIAAGHLAGPSSDFAPFWHLQQTVLTPAGWVAQHPPAHTLLLALGLRLGAVQVVGPALFGGTVYLTGLLAHRLFPTEPLTARLGTLLLTFSPFALAHAAGYSSHTSAAFFSVLVLYAAAREAERHAGRWVVLLGMGVAVLFATRPLTGVVVGSVVAVWLAIDSSRRPRPRAALSVVVAALPALVLLAWYNDHFFGGPLRFGYIAALGEDGGLGFGIDPWGNRYGLRAAVGYTAAELAALSLFLLETPLPIVSLCGLALLVLPVLQPGTRLLVAWAIVPLLAHLSYWHHGLFMGPRMLNEYAPAWCLLAAALLPPLVRVVPRAFPRARHWSPRVFAGAVVLTGWGAALLWAGPARLLSYRTAIPDRIALAGDTIGNGLIFVHGSWSARLGMQLAGAGMRLDSLETLMRENSTCTVQRWLDAGRRGVQVDFDRSDTGAENLQALDLVPGSRIRLRSSESWPPACARQAAADRAGVIEVSALIWRNGLPLLDASRSIYVRDLGPEANARLIAALGRRPYSLRVASGIPTLQPYSAAMDTIWGIGAEPTMADSLPPAVILSGHT